jgi:hypothetical protein
MEDKDYEIAILPSASKNAKIGSIWWEIKDGQRYPWMIVNPCRGYLYGEPQICQKMKRFISPEITVTLESAVGPYVEYAADASVELVEAFLPEGWMPDYSSQITVRKGLYRSPLVQSDESFVDFEDFERKFEPQNYERQMT